MGAAGFMGRLRLATIMAIIGLGPAWPALVAAQDDDKTLMEKGTAYFLREDYEDARRVFSSAYELNRRADILLKLGLAELQSDHPVEAANHLVEYLKHEDQPADKLALVRTKWLPRAQEKTARLDVFAPAGAEVLVDGAVKGRAPVPSMVVRVGEHDVTARQERITEAKHVLARGGELVEVHFQRVVDTPAQVAIARSTQDVGLTTSHDQLVRTTSPAKWIALIGTGSMALTAAGLGFGFGIASNQNAEVAHTLSAQLQKTGSCAGPSALAQCGQLRGAIQSANDFHALSDGMFLTGGAFAAATGLIWWLWPSSTLRVQPSMTGSGAAIVASGQW